MSTTTTGMGSGGVLLLALTLICWLIMLVYMLAVVGQDVHGDAVVGQAYAWIAAMAFGGLAWLWMGGLLLRAGTQDRMPPWAAKVSIPAYLLMGAAGAIAVYLLQNPARVWPVMIPALLPPVVAFYVFALYQPSLAPKFAGTGSVVVWGAILILSLAPWPSMFLSIAADNERRAESAKAQEEWRVQEGERNRAANLEKLKAMTADDPVMNWYGLLDEESGVRTEAFEALRKIERRQADIEDMLGYGIMRAMMLVPDLDLKATPRLCEVSRTFLVNRAKESRVRPKQDPRPYNGDSLADLEKILPAIRWLIAHGCDLEEGIAATEASVQSHIDSPERGRALGLLAELRKK
jgi:hypothetical protein